MKKLHIMLSAMALTVAGSMSAITGSPLVEEPGEGVQSSWSRSSMSITNFAGFMEMTDPDYGGAVTMVTAEDGTVWVDYLISGFKTNGWFTGMIEGDKMTFPLPQEIYREDGKPYYLALCGQNASEDYVMLQETELVFNKVGNMWKSDGLDSKARFMGIVSSDGYFMGTGDYDLELVPFEAPEQESDEGVDYKPFNFIYGQFGNFCELGSKDATLFIKGLIPDAPDTYITAESSDGNATYSIVAGQYLGVTTRNVSTPHHAYFMPVKDAGEDFDGIAELILAYDESSKGYSSNDTFVINYTDDPENIFYTTYCRNPKFTPANTSGRLYPANPLSVTVDKSDNSLLANIPLLSTDGTLLDADNLYYIVYVDGEPFTFFKDEYKFLDMEEMTEVPFNYTEDYDFMISGTYHIIYLYAIGYETVGVQSVYYGAGGATCSDIVNSDGTVTPSSVEAVNAAMGSEGVLYDLQGRRAGKDAKGLLIKNGRTILR